jgi:hypothetical protein
MSYSNIFKNISMIILIVVMFISAKTFCMRHTRSLAPLLTDSGEHNKRHEINLLFYKTYESEGKDAVKVLLENGTPTPTVECSWRPLPNGQLTSILSVQENFDIETRDLINICSDLDDSSNKELFIGTHSNNPNVITLIKRARKLCGYTLFNLTKEEGGTLDGIHKKTFTPKVYQDAKIVLH